MSSANPKMRLRLEYDGQQLHVINDTEINAPITIGRAEDSTWRLPKQDAGASARHAILRRQRNGTVVLEDCGSTNGIYYMGRRVKEHRLRPGDICSIGDTKLIAEEISRQKKGSLLLFHQLEQLTGEKKGKIYRIEKEIFRIGSANECECAIPDSLVSKLHAIIEHHADDTCWIKDQHSRNGTTVNGMPLREENAQIGRMLKDGDIIAIAYVEFKFWDKNVIHVRSHLILKLCAVIATLAIALGGYFGFQTFMPNAKTLRLRAERLAAQEDFAGARTLLQEAREARGADLDKTQRTDLERKLALWRETADGWSLMQHGLANGTETNAFVLECARLAASDIECWSWNGFESFSQMAQAQLSNSLLTYTRSGEEALATSVDEGKYLHDLLEKLETTTGDCTVTPLHFRDKLLARAQDTVRELRLTLEKVDSLQALIMDYTDLSKTDSIVKDIHRLQRECEERLEARAKEGRPASKTLARQCEGLLDPLLQLQRCNALLQENVVNLAKGNFAAFHAELPLPTHDACSIVQTLPTRRADLEAALASQEKIRVQLQNYCRWFDREFPNGKSALLKRFLARETLEAILSFDCLQAKMPSYTARKPSGLYDEMLGVYVFFEYLRALDADFDTTVFEERFKPGLFQAADLYRTLESFVAFCHPSERSPLAPLMAALLAEPARNHVAKLLALAEEALRQRDALVREMYGIFQKEGATRRGLVAGGIACRLMTPRHTFIKGKLNEELATNLRKLRHQLAALAAPAEAASPEKLLAIEKELLSTGLPGDPLIKQPWTDKFSK